MTTADDDEVHPRYSTDDAMTWAASVPPWSAGAVLADEVSRLRDQLDVAHSTIDVIDEQQHELVWKCNEVCAFVKQMLDGHAFRVGELGEMHAAWTAAVAAMRAVTPTSPPERDATDRLLADVRAAKPVAEMTLEEFTARPGKIIETLPPRPTPLTALLELNRIVRRACVDLLEASCDAEDYRLADDLGVEL